MSAEITPDVQTDTADPVDTGQAPVVDDAAKTAEAEPTPDAGDTKTDAGEAAQPTYEELAAKAKLGDKSAKELNRVAGVLKQKQQKIEELERAAAGATPKPDAKPRSERESRPDDLGDDDNPEWTALRQQIDAANQRSAALEERLTQREQTEEAERETELLSTQRTFVHTAAQDLRSQIMPQFTGDEGEVVDGMVVSQLESILEDESENGLTSADLTPDKVAELSLRAIENVAKLMDMAAAKQLATNQKHRDTHQIGTKGAPGFPAGVKTFFDLQKLPLHEQQRIRRDAWRDANQ